MHFSWKAEASTSKGFRPGHLPGTHANPLKSLSDRIGTNTVWTHLRSRQRQMP